MDLAQKGRVRFGPFSLDLATGELRKYNIKIALQSQPFEVLVALLKRPGELITREELRQRIWGADTHVDFDQGLNRAIKKIRAALTDSADEPRYVETLAKRGYRFVAPVSFDSEVSTAEPVIPDGVPPQGLSKNRVKAVGIGFASLMAALFYVLMMQPHPKGFTYGNPRQLTKNSAENSLTTAAISPDGNYLLFGDLAGIHLSAIARQEIRTFDRPEGVSAKDGWFPVSWFPDQSRFVAVSTASSWERSRVKSWVVSVLGGTISPLREDAFAQSVSPDGSFIAFTGGGLNLDEEIWTTGPSGEDARRLATLDGQGSFNGVQWAPDSRHISAAGHRLGAGGIVQFFIESRDLQGSPASPILSQEQPLQSLGWFSDDTMTFSGYRGDSALWEIKVEPKTGKASGVPRRTNGWTEADICSVSRSKDKKKVVFRRKTTRADVYWGELDARGHLGQPRRLTLEDSNNLPWAWTPDSRHVIFTSDRSGTIRTYKQAIDQAIAEPLVYEEGESFEPHMGPGGLSLLYVVDRLSGPERLMSIPITGGAPRMVLKANYGFDIQCPRAASAECLLSKDSGNGQMVFALLDPGDGKIRDLCTRPAKNVTGWDISPDGSEIAVMISDLLAARIELYSLSWQLRETISVKEWSRLSSLNYSADGHTFYTGDLGATGATLLRLDRKGHAEPLWQKAGANVGTWAVPSPDGRYLAILADSSAENAWMMDGK